MHQKQALEHFIYKNNYIYSCCILIKLCENEFLHVLDAQLYCPSVPLNIAKFKGRPVQQRLLTSLDAIALRTLNRWDKIAIGQLAP